jgi:hypothetical protein
MLCLRVYYLENPYPYHSTICPILWLKSEIVYPIFVIYKIFDNIYNLLMITCSIDM